ncbi:MAG: metallophosphoesterase [Thermoanaerobaculales bacterium]|nr:metallophosphoesterase [Thermoanaerobaculales bacterium]
MRASGIGFCVLLAAAAGLPGVAAASERGGEALVFIVAADMRNFAADGEWSKNFSGACEAVKAVGAGSFMISPGDLDVDPPFAVRTMIDKVIGKEYPWYPVLGNHDPESPSTMQYLREYGATVPNVVNRGPKGTAETTYSFDWGDAHFVVLNQYFDGSRDWGLEGDMVPELMAWLEADLEATEKPRIFVFGHEPILPMPDMDNGRIRHQGDSLDEHPERAFALHQLLLKHGVAAYFCGHTHNTSYAKINGLWQLDPGHARGLEEASYADKMYAAIGSAIAEGKRRGVGEAESLRQLYRDDPYHIDSWFKYLGLKGQPVVQTLAQFYSEYGSDPTARNRWYEVQIEGRKQTRSTIFRVIVGDQVTVEIYRDDARGGPYELRKTVVLH